MIKIKLKHGLTTLIDKNDLQKLKDVKLFASKTRKRFYVRIYLSRKEKPFLHRVIMNCPKHLQVDHINGNTLDNRKINLRLCTNAENNSNRGKHRDNKSGFKGVYYFKWGSRSKRFCARICSNGKSIHVGYFKTAQEAAKKYDSMAKKIHGKFALLNYEK